MTNVNLLIFIHGVVEDIEPSDHTSQYANLLSALRQKQPTIAQAIPNSQFVGVEWGHAPLPPQRVTHPDEQLTSAENTILQATKYDVIHGSPTNDDSFLDLSPLRPRDLERLAARRLVAPIKETVVTLGIADAFYYTSPDGEDAVRTHVYGEALACMDQFRDADTLAIHLVGHSQGATVGFDFLYGLLAPASEVEEQGRVPGFIADNQGTEISRDSFLYWRDRALQGTLVLGSKASFGCQIAIMMMRKQKLVDLMAIGEKLDPTVIGVPKRLSAPGAPPKWKIFYDTDDLLGYPARRLFDSEGTIKEYEVDSDPNPVTSHSLYWTNDQVRTEIARLIAQNLI